MPPTSDPIVIVSAVRTPIGSFHGALKGRSAIELGAQAIRAAVERAGAVPEDIDEVLMGCVLPAGLKQGPARQAARGAGLPDSAASTTINKLCGSGMKAAMAGADALTLGDARMVVAGGMESMTNAPYLLEKARSGYKAGHAGLMDHLFLDGLEDAYEPGRTMGTFAEDTAAEYGFSREAQDAFALTSLERANRAIREGAFAREIVAIDGIENDEQPGRGRPERIPLLKPAFREGGTITAANSSSISDGAAALVLTRLSVAEAKGLKPIAAIRGYTTHAQKPALFTTAPVFAMQKLFERVGWRAGEVDLYEINEAFAAVTMVAMRELGLGHERVNVNGGACALGHPLGCSGARVIVTLLAALQARGLKRGVATLCIGGGEATAMAVEIL